MLPGLKPIDKRKTRALTTIYAPRNAKHRKNKTADTRSMLKELPQQFNALPAIGKTDPVTPKSNVVVFDIDSRKPDPSPGKLRVMKHLSPLKHAHGASRPLIRENTYDVIKPMYSRPPLRLKSDSSISDSSIETVRETPKARFRRAVNRVAKLNNPEGRLLCLREREKIGYTSQREKKLIESSDEKITKLTEIFQSLGMKGRHRPKIKKENNWF